MCCAEIARLPRNVWILGFVTGDLPALPLSALVTTGAAVTFGVAGAVTTPSEPDSQENDVPVGLPFRSSPAR